MKKKRNTALKAACLAAGMATAWAATQNAEANTIEPLDHNTVRIIGAITPTQTLNRAHIVYANHSSGIFAIWDQLDGPFPANIATPYIETSSGWPFEDFPGERYAIIASYQGDTQTGVAVSFPDASGIIGQQSWPDIFESPSDGRRDWSEAQILDAINNPEFGGFDLRLFFLDYYDVIGTVYGNNATLVNFSNGTFGGIVTPEPGSLIFFSIWCLGFLLVRPRSRTSK
jgi:hypothetical protein